LINIKGGERARARQRRSRGTGRKINCSNVR
jgi:hypothetical protein